MIEEAREQSRDDLRAERKADRKLQKERLDELVPRAEPGTRERKLEKKQKLKDRMEYSTIEVTYNVPDRGTGLQELEELRRLCPHRKWNFVSLVDRNSLKSRLTVYHR